MLCPIDLAKRLFDIVVSFFALLVLCVPILVCVAICAWDTRASGIFRQKRIGRFARPFTIFKLRTMDRDGRISAVGRFFRKSKIDEFPQFWNVLKGDMSIVGPRPDVPGFYDCLEGDDRRLLELRPGLTSEAALKYFDEEQLLSAQPDPERYNTEILFPDKLKINLEYYRKRSLFVDLRIIFKSIFR